MVNKFRVILGVVGYFMIAGAIGDMDVTNTMTFTHMIFISVGFVYVIQSISLLRKELWWKTLRLSFVKLQYL